MTLAGAICLLSLSLQPVFARRGGPDLETRAEASNFKATSLHAEVLDFLRSLQERSDQIRLETFGYTVEGRELPLAVLGSPPPSDPREVFEARLPVVLIFANIHAGEVEGKEASLMLVRDVLLGDLGHLIENQVVLIAPIYNADGNDRISTSNRTNQVGPRKGVGERQNAQGLDLNRDFIKLESPEARALVMNVLNRWDPHVAVDLHTTNGSYHQEPLMYSWPLNPFTDRVILTHTRDRLLFTVDKAVLEKHGYESIPYGNFRDRFDPEQGWVKYGTEARYSTNYIGLRNRMAVLNENYAYADYETRVRVCYAFCREILEYTRERGAEIRKLALAADGAVSRRPTFLELPLEVEARPFPKKLEIKSYVFEIEENDAGVRRPVPTRKKRDYLVPFYGDYQPVRTVAAPAFYLFDSSHAGVIENLLQHGLRVDALTRDVDLEIESFGIAEVEAGERPFQGHYLNRASGEWRTEKRRFPEGTICVRVGQPLGRLAVYLLEPESSDGLLAWNFFDRHLTAGQWRPGWAVYPVYRLMDPERRLPLHRYSRTER